MKKIEIKKSTSDKMDAIACWRVNAEGAMPNTLVVNDEEYTLHVSIDGVLKRTSEPSFTLHGLLNPGKTNKLIGGTKPYRKVEITAADQDSNFNAEWGFGGPTAIVAIDRQMGGIECNVRAFGEYHFQIQNYYAFLKTFRSATISEQGEITKNAIRDYLRTESIGIIKNYLSSALGAKDLIVCQGEKEEYCEEITELLAKHLEPKGVAVKSFQILRMEYDEAHQRLRAQKDSATAGVIVGRIENEGKKDDISVQDAAADVQVKLIDAHARAEKAGVKPDDLKVVYCPRCGTKNEDSRFCKKCGEKLVSPIGHGDSGSGEKSGSKLGSYRR